MSILKSTWCILFCFFFFWVHFSLNELVQHGKNGYVFKTDSELSAQIQDWFENFPLNEKQKEIEKRFKSEIELFQKQRWRDNWKKTAAQVFNI